MPLGPHTEVPGMTGGGGRGRGQREEEEEDARGFPVVSTAQNGQDRVQRLRSG